VTQNADTVRVVNAQTRFEHPHAECAEIVACWESWADEAKKEIRKLQAENARLRRLIDGGGDAS
jgi:hypothetical protein